jgi:hypothetical protein
LLKLAVVGHQTFALYFWVQYTGMQLTSAHRLNPRGRIDFNANSKSGSSTVGGATEPAQPGGLEIVPGWRHDYPVADNRDEQTGYCLEPKYLCLLADAIAFFVCTMLSKRWMADVSPVDVTGTPKVGGAVELLLLSLADPIANWWSALGSLSARQ